MRKERILKGIFSIALLGMFVLMLAVNVSAEFWACFEKGEVIDYCNPNRVDVTCRSDMGCIRCMSQYLEENNCYAQGNPNVCNGIRQDCNNFGGGDDGDGGVSPEVDGEPPELTIISPVDGEIYGERGVMTKFTSNEKATVHYIDSADSVNKWRRLCSFCTFYDRKRSFSDGLHNLTLRAVDVLGYDSFFDITFFVDSTRPRLLRSEPRRGFASGFFGVQFREDNPEDLVLHFGTPGNMKSQEISTDENGEIGVSGGEECGVEDVNDDGVVDQDDVDMVIVLMGTSDDGADVNDDGIVDEIDLDAVESAVGTCGGENSGEGLESSCIYERRRYSCEAFLDLDEFNGQEIEYWFELEDIAGSRDIGRKGMLKVDTTPPEFDLSYEIGTRGRVTLILNVTEDNFDEAVYEVTSDSRPRERRLCSRLRDGVCEKRISLRGSGDHHIDIRVYDEAGNSAGESLVIGINS